MYDTYCKRLIKGVDHIEWGNKGRYVQSGDRVEIILHIVYVWHHIFRGVTLKGNTSIGNSIFIFPDILDYILKTI